MLTKEQLNFYREWSKDLRSGQFTQCRHRLHNGVGHCCLGVACRTAMRLGMPMREALIFNKHYFIYKDQDNEYGLPERFVHEMGFREFQKLNELRTAIWFATLNDDDKYTFEQIADVIDDRIKEIEEQ